MSYDPESEVDKLCCKLDETETERDALKSEVERLKVELERAKADRDAEGMRVRGELLPKLQAMADELEKQGHLSWVKLEIVKGELKEAQAAAAVMREALEKWRKYFQSDIPKNADEQDVAGEQFTDAWFDMERALSSNAGTVFLARMAEAEWLIKTRGLGPYQSKEWIDRCDAFLKGEGVKA